MSEIIKYGYLSTKIRAMKGKMLNQKDYDELVLKKSVAEAANYLKNNTYYHDALEKININDVHRGQLEVLLYRAAVTDALKIAKNLTGSNKKIYRYIYRKLEIEDIKKMLRTLQMGKPLSELDRSTLFVSRYSRIDFNVSLLATNVVSLVETLKDTNFYMVLKPLIQRDGNIDMFSAEMALDLYYFQRTDKQLKKMDEGKDKELFRKLIGLEEDFKNLMWIYRAKNVYGLNREMIIRYLIPTHYKLKLATLTEMIDARNPEELLKLVNATFYGKIIDFNKKSRELEFTNYLFHIQEQSMRIEPFSLAPIIAYMYIKEIEVKNITNIVEGIRYNVDVKEINEYLVGVN